MDNPIFKMIVAGATPVLLGVLVTLAISINSAQKDQGEKLSIMQGQMAVIGQQNTDYGTRLGKLELTVDDNRRSIGTLAGRVLVLESQRLK